MGQRGNCILSQQKYFFPDVFQATKLFSSLGTLFKYIKKFLVVDFFLLWVVFLFFVFFFFKPTHLTG